jgi:hypothetical protein
MDHIDKCRSQWPSGLSHVILMDHIDKCRSQWPSGLSHVMDHIDKGRSQWPSGLSHVILMDHIDKCRSQWPSGRSHVILMDHIDKCRSQWPSGLSHELFFPRWKAGIMGSNPARGLDVCVCIYSVSVVLCVGSGLARGWSPVQGVLPHVYKIKKLKKRPRTNKRAVEP